MKRAMRLALPAMAMTLLLSIGSVRLVRADSDVGWLDVDVTSPPPAAISIDGAGLTDKAGKPLLTPQTHLPLSTGSHSLLLQTPDGKTSKMRFSIAKNHTTQLTLQPK